MFQISGVFVERDGIYKRKTIPINVQKSRCFLHPFKIASQPEKAGYYAVVRLDTDEAILIDESMTGVLNALALQTSVTDINQLYNIENLSIIKFLQELANDNFIKSIDNNIFLDLTDKINPQNFWDNPQQYSWITHKVTLTVILLFIISALIASAFNHDLIPQMRHYFWTTDIFTLFVISEISLYLLGFIHEFAHFLTTKAIGGKARINIFSHRFIDLVFETESYHISIVPKHKRYLVYISGMATDFIIISAIFWTLQITTWTQTDIGIIKAVLQMIVLQNIIGIIWQFNVFLETDIYNFLSDKISQPNLYNNTKKLLGITISKNILRFPRSLRNIVSQLFINKKILHNADDFRVLTRQEKKIIKLYEAIMFLGLTVTLINFLLFILPKNLYFVAQNFNNLLVSFTQGDKVSTIKNGLLLIILTYGYIILLIMLNKKLKKQKV